MGTFIELEILTTQEKVKKSEEAIKTELKKINQVFQERMIQKSYLELILDKNLRKK